jgi:hypothetical protein
VVWRTAQWYDNQKVNMVCRTITDDDRYPKLVSHVFSICTPYAPARTQYLSNEDITKKNPRFAYQIHLASGEIEKSINDEQSIRQFLKAIFGGRTPDRQVGFDPRSGILLENLSSLGESSILNGKVSLRSSFFWWCGVTGDIDSEAAVLRSRHHYSRCSSSSPRGRQSRPGMDLFSYYTTTFRKGDRPALGICLSALTAVHQMLESHALTRLC